MSPHAYVMLGMTAIVAMLAATLTFALLRFFAAARDVRGTLGARARETAWMSDAVQDAVTRLKAQEQSMAARAVASERTSDAIIASLTSGLLLVDRARHVRIVNPAGRRLLELPETIASGGDYRTLLAHVPALAAVVDECLDRGRAVSRRSIELSLNGRRRLFGVTVSPLQQDGEPGHAAVCLFADLTSVRDLEEQVRLKESLARVGELTAGLAHEFRNGLSTIHGYARLIVLEELPPAYRPYVQALRDETQALGDVVTRFLTFARPTPLALARADLRAIVDRTADEVRADGASHGGTIDVHGTFPAIEGDEVLLRQALGNLLRNAVEACAAAGKVPAIEIVSELDADQQMVRIAVCDNGPGIREADRERIFQPFFTTRPDGTGLGLAIVQKIIVSHNGRIAVDAAPDGGARFHILLPLAAAEVV